jgi:translocation protein SEC62
VGNERVEYFRLDDFDKLVEEKSESIKKDEKLDGLIKNAYDEFVFFRRPDTVKIKYPKSLEPVPATHPDKKYASFRFDTTESHKGMTILLICLVLGVVLFPIWPYEVKYGIWLISLFLLVVMVGIIVIRLVIFLLLAIFNYNIWIFPNLFYSNGILDSFIPVIEVSKGDRSWFNMFIRLFALSVFILLSVHVYLNPTFIDGKVYFTQNISR